MKNQAMYSYTDFEVPSEVVEELKDFVLFRNANTDFSLSNYAWMNLTPDIFLATVSLLSPRFTVRRGVVLFTDSYTEDLLNKWIKELDGEITKIEKTMNHRHVKDLIQGVDRMSATAIQLIGNIFAQFWRSAATSQLPTINLHVSVEWDEVNCDAVILLYQDRLAGARVVSE